MARRPPQSAFSFQIPRMMPGIRALLIALAMFSIGVGGVRSWISPEVGGRLEALLTLQPSDVWHGHVWELFTFTLLETTAPGFLISAVMLWIFGTQLEQLWGTRRFLFFYFSTTALAGLAAAVIGLVIAPVGHTLNAGGWASIEALCAGFALSFPTAQILLAFVLPIQARLLIPISLGITLLFVIMHGNVYGFVVPVLALGAGVLLHDARDPKNLWLRIRVRWIERKMRGSRLRVVPGLPTDEELPARRSGGRGSDGFLH